jgi:hypothetical protein
MVRATAPPEESHMTGPNTARPTHASPRPRATRPAIVSLAGIVALMATYLGLFARSAGAPGLGATLGALILYAFLEGAVQTAAAHRRRRSPPTLREAWIRAEGRRAAHPVLVFGVLLTIGAGFLGTAPIALAALASLGLAFATAARLAAERSAASASLGPVGAP